MTASGELSVHRPWSRRKYDMLEALKESQPVQFVRLTAASTSGRKAPHYTCSVQKKAEPRRLSRVKR